MLARNGQEERAIELLALALHHPQSIEVMVEKAPEVLDELRSGLSSTALKGAQARGQARDLGATMAELSAELGPAVHGSYR